jgi:enamine deaminase RidA (YjgF/YER057c/UK114 family)
MSARDRLDELGLSMPDPPEPAGAYTRAIRAGGLIFVAGQLPLQNGKIAFAGKVGSDLSIDEGYAACQLCALNALSILEAECGSLDEIKQIVRMSGFVCSAAGFTDQAKVVNGASELMKEVLGERGVHARLAVGVSELPLGAAVELEVIAQA